MKKIVGKNKCVLIACIFKREYSILLFLCGQKITTGQSDYWEGCFSFFLLLLTAGGAL